MDSNNSLEEAKVRVGWGHSTWKDCTEVSKKCGVKKLNSFHHDPFHDDNSVFEKEAFARGLLETLFQPLKRCKLMFNG